MPTVLDISGILHSSLHTSIKMKKDKNVASQWMQATDDMYSEDMLRHLMMNQIRTYRNLFYREYGEIVIAVDSDNVWRKDYHPFYKASRAEGRKASDINWTKVYATLNQFLLEIDENFPYKVIKVNRLEADDIIATIAMNKHYEDKMMIVSSDKDLLQLQQYDNVKQYSHIKKQEMKESNPRALLLEHILRGDSGDGVPNVLSDSDTFIISGKRQNTLSKKKFDELASMDSKEYDSRIRDNYQRNKKCVDLSEIPQEYQDEVMALYNVDKPRDNSKIMKYFVSHKMKNLLTHRSEF